MAVHATMIGPLPHPDFKGNGMGAFGLQPVIRWLLWFARDLDLDQTVARFHDWAYSVGGSETERQFADEALWLNIRSQMRANWRCRARLILKRLLFGRLLPWACYRVVHRFGRLSWEYEQAGDRDRELALAAKVAKFGYVI